MTTVRTLIVDDDIAVLAHARAILEARGHRVFCTSDASRALHITRRHRVDVVITDMIMPQADGLDVARRIRTTLPHVAVIVMSGGSGLVPKQFSLSLGRLAEPHHLLEKPFTASQLWNAITLARREAQRCAHPEPLQELA